MLLLDDSTSLKFFRTHRHWNSEILGKILLNAQFFKISGWKIFVVPDGQDPYRGPGPEASASPASWMIRLWLTDISLNTTLNQLKQGPNCMQTCIVCEIWNWIVYR